MQRFKKEIALSAEKSKRKIFSYEGKKERIPIK
jgi:hypothetical protein